MKRSQMRRMAYGMVALKSAVWRWRGRAGQDRLDVDDESHVEHPIGLVEDDGVDAVEPQLAAPDEVEHPTRRADHDLRAALEALDLLVHRRAAVDGDGAHVAELADAARSPR